MVSKQWKKKNMSILILNCEYVYIRICVHGYHECKCISYLQLPTCPPVKMEK